MKTSTKISLSDIPKIGSEHEYWILHVIESTQNLYLDIQPISGEPNSASGLHSFKILMTQIDIPVFEIFMSEAIDFISYLDDTILNKIKGKSRIGPIILGFNHKRLVKSTFHNCYCVEGIIEIIGEMNPELLKNLASD